MREIKNQKLKMQNDLAQEKAFLILHFSF